LEKSRRRSKDEKMSLEKKCLACNSENLDKGNLYTVGGTAYQSGGRFSAFNFSKMFEIDVYACLDCGYIGAYLPEKELNRLRILKAKQAKKKKE